MSDNLSVCILSYQQGSLTDFLLLPGDHKRIILNIRLASSSQGMLKKELVLIVHIQKQVRLHNLG